MSAIFYVYIHPPLCLLTVFNSVFNSPGCGPLEGYSMDLSSSR